jgi:drug/metabolite transporter (DMT)-like permease
VSTRIATVIVLAAAVASSLATTVLTSVAMDSLPDAVLVAASLVVAVVLVVGGGGWRVLGGLRSLERSTLWLALAGGAMTFWAAPFITLLQRGTSAPSGADTLFLTTTVWGTFVVLGAYLVASERQALTGIAGAVCAAVGAAGLLASWEYPSSFSPFAIFPMREAFMLVAGVIFAAGVLALAEAARRKGAMWTATIGLVAAAALGILASVPALPTVLYSGAGAWRPSVYLGVATACFAVSLLWVAERVGAARASVAMLLVAPALTAVSAYESATAVYGVNPFEMRGVLVGSAIVLMGAAVVWMAGADHRASRAARDRTSTIAFWVAVAACLGAAVSLGTPALAALAEGHLSVTFRAAWTMVGFESAAGWLPVAAALLALTAALEARRGQTARSWLIASVAVFACALAMPALAATTLHTWNSWIPADVQQTYGTEYARFAVSAIVDPVRTGAIALAVLSAGMLGFSAARNNGTARSTEEGS